MDNLTGHKIMKEVFVKKKSKIKIKCQNQTSDSRFVCH